MIVFPKPISVILYIYNANGILALLLDYSFIFQANWLKFGMLKRFDVEKVQTEPENGKNL